MTHMVSSSVERTTLRGKTNVWVPPKLFTLVQSAEAAFGRVQKCVHGSIGQVNVRLDCYGVALSIVLEARLPCEPQVIRQAEQVSASQAWR